MNDSFPWICDMKQTKFYNLQYIYHHILHYHSWVWMCHRSHAYYSHALTLSCLIKRHKNAIAPTQSWWILLHSVDTSLIGEIESAKQPIHEVSWWSGGRRITIIIRGGFTTIEVDDIDGGELLLLLLIWGTSGIFLKLLNISSQKVDFVFGIYRTVVNVVGHPLDGASLSKVKTLQKWVWSRILNVEVSLRWIRWKICVRWCRGWRGRCGDCWEVGVLWGWRW